MHQYVQQHHNHQQQQQSSSNMMYSQMQEQYKSTAGQVTSATRKRIGEKSAIQQSQLSNAPYLQNGYDPSILSTGQTLTGFQQNSSKSSSSQKENQIFKSNPQNYISIFNQNANGNVPLYQSGASSAKGSQNKDVKMTIGSNQMSANLLKHSSTLQAQQQQGQQQQQQQPLQQNNQRKPSISNVARPQKFSISIQNRDSSQNQQEILSDDRNYTSHVKKQSYQHGVSATSQAMQQQQSKQLTSNHVSASNNHSTKSQLNSQAQLYTSSTASSFIIQNSNSQQQPIQSYHAQTISNQINSNANNNKNITKDLINYKILQIQANNNKIQNNQAISNNQNGITSNQNLASNINQQNYSTKSSQQIPNNSGRTSQQLIITSARRADSSSAQTKQREKIINDQIKISNSRHQDQPSLNEQRHQQATHTEDFSADKYVSQQNVSQINQLQNLQQQQQHQQQYSVTNISQINHNNYNSNTINHNTNNTITNNNNNNHLNFNNQYTFSNISNHSLHEKNTFSLQQQQFNSNTLNPSQYNISSNYSSFGTLPKGTSANILKQHQNAQNLLNPLPQYQIQSDQQNSYSMANQHYHTYQKNNELEINSATNLVLSDQELFRDLINNRGSTKNTQKNAQNYFASQQNRQQMGIQSKNQIEQQNIIKENIQAISNKSPEVLVNITENYNKNELQQFQQQQQQQLQQQKSIDILEDYDDDDDTPVIHNHALMQQKYSKRVGISVSAVPDISKLSSLINKCGVKRVGIDMTAHKQMLESKKNQNGSNNNSTMSQIQNQLLQQASQPTSVKGSKSSNSLIPYYQQIQKKLKSQIKEDTTTQKVAQKEVQQVKQQPAGSISQNVTHNNNQIMQQMNNTTADNINQQQPQQITKKPAENGQKSRLHQQKIKSFYQQNSQNQYYLVNPNTKPKNPTQNQMAPAASQNSSQSQMNSNYNLTQQSLQKEDELYTNKSERLMYNNYTSNAGSNGNTIIQNEDKSGFQSERFNYINAHQILQNYNSNQKESETTNTQNKIPVQSHLKVAQQLVQQHLKSQNNIPTSQLNEQIQQNQLNIQKKLLEKQQLLKQQSGNFIDNTSNSYYYPQQNYNDMQNNTCNAIPQSISHNQTNINHIPYSQSVNYGVGSANTSQFNTNFNNHNLSSNQNQSLNIHQQQQQQLQNNTTQDQQAIQKSSNTSNQNIKSHLKANPTNGVLSGVTSFGSANTKYSATAVASTSSVSSTQNLHIQQNNNNEVLSNFTVSPNVPTFSNQIGLLSVNSNNSSNNRKIENQSTSAGCGSGNNVSQFGAYQNNGNSTQNSAINQHNKQNILSTAIKSETTQYSNFSSDSPLVCNENLSGILTNRYGDNSQFKNFLSTKSNNVSSNNINQGQNTSTNQQQNNTSSLIQPLSDNNRDKPNNPQIQNFISQTQQNPQINSKIGVTSIQPIEEYNNASNFGQSQPSLNLNNYGGQNSNSNNNLSGNSQTNNDSGAFKPSHKKNLSSHLINKLGAICKVATEGSQQFTQSSSNNSYNKENHSFNNNTNSNQTNTAVEKFKQETIPENITQKEEADELQVAENLKDSIEQITKDNSEMMNYLTNKSTNYQESVEDKVNKEEEETLEQQLLNFSHRNIVNENIEYRIKDMKEQELDYLPNPDYFDNQKEITCMMRCILFDWMFDVCMGLMLKRDTLYLSLNYVDRFLSLQQVTKLNLQLIGAVSLFMACKIEEIHPPSINEFAKCTDDGYTVQQIVEHELLMLKAFEWKLNPPTQIVWLNIYTEIWDRFIKSSFEKPNKYQVNFVQDQKLSNKNYLILYRIPDQKSYMLYRQMTQILDLMQLDANVLRFESRMLIASLMYLQLGIYYKQFTKKQVHAGFSEKYLFANSLNNFNEYFNSFLTLHFQFNLIDILSSLQYVASFFDIDYNYSLSPAAQIIDPANNEMSYEDYLSYQTYFPNGIDYMRKRYCS